MNTRWLRRMLEQNPIVGMPLVAAFLLLHFLRKRGRLVLAVLTLGGPGVILWCFIAQPKPLRFQRAAYSVSDLGALPGQPDSGAKDINDRGEVVGWSGVQFQKRHAFLWSNGKMQDLGAPGGAISEAVSINEQSQIVGWSGNVTHKEENALLWENGKARLLGTLPGYEFSNATGISDQGYISGIACKQHEDRAFLWKEGSFTDIGALPQDDESGAYDINNRGQIVGFSRCYNYLTGYIYQEGQMRPLKGLGDGKATRILAINNRGAVVGTAETTRSRTYFHHACLWEPGREDAPLDLGTLGGGKSVADDINDKGQIVGWSILNDDHRQPTRAFLWQNGKMQDLNRMIPADSGWTLQKAEAINERGQIVGVGTHNGAARAFLLTPQ